MSRLYIQMKSFLPTVLFVVAVCLCTGSTFYDIAETDIHSIRVLSTISDTVVLDNQRARAVIFAGGYACSACYGELEHAIQQIDSTIQVVMLLRVSGSSVVSRKEEIKRMERLVQSRTFYFDVTSQATYRVGSYDDGLFGKYGVSISPSVLFLLPGRPAVFINYSTLFYQQSGEINDVSSAPRINRCVSVIREAIRP